MSKRNDRCADCTRNEGGIKCTMSRPEWHNGKQCNAFNKKHTDRIRIVKHPRIDMVTFYSDMER